MSLFIETLFFVLSAFQEATVAVAVPVAITMALAATALLLGGIFTSMNDSTNDLTKKFALIGAIASCLFVEAAVLYQMGTSPGASPQIILHDAKPYALAAAGFALMFLVAAFLVASAERWMDESDPLPSSQDSISYGAPRAHTAAGTIRKGYINLGSAFQRPNLGVA